MPQVKINYQTLSAEHCKQAEYLLRDVFSYAPTEEHYTIADLEHFAEVFSEGCIVALDDEYVVGIGIGFFVSVDLDHLPATEEELIFPNGALAHSASGDYYFGTDLAVRPSYRRMRIARTIYDKRKEVIVKYNKKGFLAASLLPGYENEKHKMSLESYLDKVVAGEIFDPTLSIQLRNEFKVLKPLKNFFEHEESDHSSALIFWENGEYEE